MKNNYLTHSPDETKLVASELAKELKGGEVIELSGDLGSGKTTFVQGFVEAFGYKGPVRSPTFSIMNIYPVEYGKIHQIVHIDLYRLEKKYEIYALGLEEWMNRQDTLMLVEWLRFENVLQLDVAVRVELEIISAQNRKINIIFL